MASGYRKEKTMGKWVTLMVLSLLFLPGCEGDSMDIGEQGGEAISDTELMREATATANKIIRNGADCEVVKSNIQEVNRKLDEIEAKLQTATGRTAIQTTKKHVKSIADACGAY